jgi:hypothetical protein
MNLQRRLRVADARMGVRLCGQSLEDALDLDPRGRSEAVADD